MHTTSHRCFTSLMVLILGCASDTDMPRDSEPTADKSQSHQKPNLTQPVLPITLEQVTRDSEYSLLEAHANKGGGYFWEFISPDGWTIIEVKANDNSQLTNIVFCVRHVGQKSNLTDDLDLIQAHIRRILPNESWANEKQLGWSDTNQSFQAKKVHGSLVLELLTRKNGDTILTISPVLQTSSQ